MKTIQQIIKEMDPIDIEKAYYAEYPMYDLPEEETYPEEDEKKDAYYRAAIEYTNYCKKMEMQKIKAALS